MFRLVYAFVMGRQEEREDDKRRFMKEKVVYSKKRRKRQEKENRIREIKMEAKKRTPRWRKENPGGGWGSSGYKRERPQTPSDPMLE